MIFPILISIMRKNNLHFYQSMFDDEENFENTDDRLEKIPLYKKGLEILDLVRQIADLISTMEEMNSLR